MLVNICRAALIYLSWAPNGLTHFTENAVSTRLTNIQCLFLTANLGKSYFSGGEKQRPEIRLRSQANYSAYSSPRTPPIDGDPEQGFRRRFTDRSLEVYNNVTTIKYFICHLKKRLQKQKKLKQIKPKTTENSESSVWVPSVAQAKFSLVVV